MAKVALWLSLFLALFESQAYANWCGKTDPENFEEFSTLYGATVSHGPGHPMVYIFGAPWCPYCAQVFRALQTRRYGFDVRFVPVDGMGDVHTKQIADIAIDASVSSLVRVYVQRVAVQQGFTDEQRKFVEIVQASALSAARERANRGTKTFGTPIAYFMANGRLQTVFGVPNLDAIERGISRGAGRDLSAETRPFLRTGLPKIVPISGLPRAKRDNTRLRVLPTPSSFSMICMRGNMGLEAAGAIYVNQEPWLVFPDTGSKAVTTYFYGRGSEFANWSRR